MRVPQERLQEPLGLECSRRHRDARTFPGGMPVIAHPPCRYWIGGLFGRQAIAAARPGGREERQLGRWCVEQVRRCGGILEPPRVRIVGLRRICRRQECRDLRLSFLCWYGRAGGVSSSAKRHGFTSMESTELRSECRRCTVPFMEPENPPACGIATWQRRVPNSLNGSWLWLDPQNAL